MSKEVKLLIDNLYLKNGVVYKKDKIFYKYKDNFLKNRFSLLILSAKNFNLNNIKKIIETFSFPEITDFVIVVGNYSDKNLIIENFKNLNGKVIVNPEPQDVLYSSLKIGLKAVSRRVNFIILQFSSLHNIKKETVKILIEKAIESKKDIIIPTFNEKKGHPIVFKSNLIPLFNSLRKEKGLPYLLKNYKDCIEEVEVSDKNIL
ncbi:MAG: NTP transferase domain-containing protein [Caldisericia bacterium]|nr:NTP transferase domain-containing protein [Caldisericia bacterium]